VSGDGLVGLDGDLAVLGQDFRDVFVVLRNVLVSILGRETGPQEWPQVLFQLLSFFSLNIFEFTPIHFPLCQEQSDKFLAGGVGGDFRGAILIVGSCTTKRDGNHMIEGFKLQTDDPNRERIYQEGGRHDIKGHDETIG
jgi:hypothetical protein